MKLKSKNVRLSQHISPKRYSITLFPNLNEFTFKGEEEIHLDIKDSISKIVLHAAELEIESAEFVQKSNKLPGKVFLQEKEEIAILSFDQKISKGEGRLHLKFTGILNDKMRGFYRSKYNHDGKDHHMAVTQFESTDARRAFPSFDEPSKKAIFDIRLIVPHDHTAISNTIESEIKEHSPGYKIITFSPTPKMSTYLLAFIVGKLEFIEKKTKSSKKIRVFTTFGKKHQAEFALTTAVKILEFYESYFGINYPLPVLDLIAIPDFAAGAMENWGAITYRETALLVDKDLSSTANKQWVALVIGHELAHMWFGNLVTMEWWTHLWLNEGFASYIEYLAVDHVFPKWHIWEQFVYMDHSKALELDSLENTHAIEIEVHHPSEISEIFDAVSYSKGASIIRMLASFLGEKNFRNGLRMYLKKHSYSNASTTNLWESLGKASKKDVGKIMQNWTGKPGYPLIKVEEHKNQLKISQTRFFSNPISAKKSTDQTIWSIPLDDTLFSKKSSFIPKSENRMKLNSEEASFVRTHYDESLFKNLRRQTEEKRLSTIDRFGILRDAFSLSQSGHLSTDAFLNLASVSKKDTEYIVWAQIAEGLSVVKNLIYFEKYLADFEYFCRDIFSEIARKVGWEKKKNEDHKTTLLRRIVLFSLGTNGDKKTISYAKERFKKITKGNSKVDADLKGVIYNLVAENGEESEYEQLLSLYLNVPFQEEKDRVFRSLCLFKDKKLLKRSLEFAFSKDMRAQDRFKAVSFVWSNPVGRDLAWEYVKKNWKEIQNTFEGGHLYSRFIQPGVNFVDRKKAKEIEKFFKKNPSPGLERTISQVTEQIRANAMWIKRDKKNIENWIVKS